MDRLSGPTKYQCTIAAWPLRLGNDVVIFKPSDKTQVKRGDILASSHSRFEERALTVVAGFGTKLTVHSGQSNLRYALERQPADGSVRRGKLVREVWKVVSVSD